MFFVLESLGTLLLSDPHSLYYFIFKVPIALALYLENC